MSTILFIDQDSKEHAILNQVFPEHCIKSAYSAGMAWKILETTIPDLILMDVMLPDADGPDVIARLSRLRGNPPIIVLSAYSAPARVVRAVRCGAVNYLEKPFNLKELRRVILESLFDRVIGDTAENPQETDLLDCIKGTSQAIRKLKDLIVLYADTEYPVLITGESGSGKELVAGTLRDLSKRGDRPYRVVHCGAIPDTLIEAEIYGSEPGAFTGAVKRQGYFEQAHRGTLFLDEIGEMPPEGQVKLLRILEDKSIIRIGGTHRISIDVRILSATNRILNSGVKDGSFRKDLLHRINTLSIVVPPLRDRRGDIPALSRHLLGNTTEVPEPFSRGAITKLMNHEWPGNVRELRNVLQRAEINARHGRIEAEHILFEETCKTNITAAIS